MTFCVSGHGTMTSTWWPSLTNPRGERFSAMWGALFYRFMTPRAVRNKADLPGWAPASFVGDVRSKANVERVHAIVLDYDDGSTSRQDAAEFWSPYWGMLHTSVSHAPECHRFRVIIPTSKPLTVEQHAGCMRWAHAAASRAGHVLDASTKDSSRFWYVPGVLPGGEYVAKMLVGARAIDPDFEREEEPSRPDVAAVDPHGVTRPCLERARRYVAKMPAAVAGQGGHAATFRVALALAQGFALGDAEQWQVMIEYNARCVPRWRESDLRHKLESASKSNLPKGWLRMGDKR